MAEGVRFELTGACAPAVFKTAAFNHSATPPLPECAVVSVGGAGQDFASIPKRTARGKFPDTWLRRKWTIEARESNTSASAWFHYSLI